MLDLHLRINVKTAIENGFATDGKAIFLLRDEHLAELSPAGRKMLAEKICRVDATTLEPDETGSVWGLPFELDVPSLEEISEAISQETVGEPEKLFKIGDVIRLKSGGPKMTVNDQGGDLLVASWFVGSDLESHFFPLDTVELA